MEREFHKWLAANLPASPHLKLGFGDDAAVLGAFAERDIVVTTDTVTDEVDFHLADVDPAAVGHKALGVNLSDLAAMAAEPVAAVVSLVLPRQGGAGLSALHLAVELYRGLLPLAQRFGLAIAGGDTNSWDHPLAVTVTAIGRTTARGPLTRSDARAGDWLLLTGSVGGSILGRHLRVEPRVTEAMRLHQHYELHAGMDISDGLALDASRLAAASGCGVALHLDQIPISDDARQLARSTGRTPLAHALGDGEDFELLLAAPADAAARILRDQPLGIAITHIGSFVDAPGLWQADEHGILAPLPDTGFEH